MNLTPLTEIRRLVPRWREFVRAAEAGETRVARRHSPRVLSFDRELYETKLAAWNDNNNVVNACDLIEAAYVLGKNEDASEAAKYVLEKRAHLPPGPGLVAQAILSQLGEMPEPNEQVVDKGEISVRARVHALRNRAHNSPHIAIYWVDLARGHAVAGQVKKAISTMQIALRLAPNNRFVLRSAARLFVHSDEPDRALYFLGRSDRLKSDPWLLAADMATRSVGEFSQKYSKTNRQLLRNSNVSPFDISELAGAMGTESYLSADYKWARRYFKQGLADPTENTVAQAIWASQFLTSLPPLENSLKHLPFGYEARMRTAARCGEWNDALAYCQEWLLDEPFSTIPAISGSYYSAVALGDYLRSERFAREGLRANPREAILLNNLSVSLAKQGRLADAKVEYSKIRQSENDEEDLETTLLATEGLLAFRSGELEVGRRKYREAITQAKEKGWKNTQVLALLHYFEEEQKAEGGGVVEVFEEIIRLLEKSKDKAFRAMLSRLKA